MSNETIYRKEPRRTRVLELIHRSLVGSSLCLVLLCSSSAEAQERIGTSSQPLTIKDVLNWTANGNVVPVCWETAGYAREKAIVQEAVSGTWQWYANLQFTGWGDCPTSGPAKHVRIRISPQDGGNAGAGGVTPPQLGMGLLSSADEDKPGIHFSFNPDGTAALGRVEYLAVHEFGHVLGFVHEQDTPGNVEGPAYCESPGNEPNSRPLTPYDRDSIMNYCNRDGNLKGNLTDIDVLGVQAVYGVRIANVASRNSCNSAVVRQTASVAWGWDDGSAHTSLALFASAGTKFQERTLLSLREGGWGDDVKWFAGDFNGDGLTDIGAAWDNGGSNTLTVRQTTASGVSAAHWAVDAGGWSPTAVWLPGDFDGDGRTDVAGAWNHGGLVSIAVYLSDGTSFRSPTQWSLRDGGWGDSVKWFAGDFDGDGRTDIGTAWNNNGAITLTVRRSTGSSFGPGHWSADAGNWSDSSAFVPGDFDGDGRTDVARLWNDLGRNSTSVSLSNGASFLTAVDWSVRDGGWILGDAVKWFPGDFDGDGRSDIGVAWNDANFNTVTVRRSLGSSFVPSHWAVKSGGWVNTATWCSGQFKSAIVGSDTVSGEGIRLRRTPG